MGLLAAARLGDEITHTSWLGMIAKVGAGIVINAAVGFAVGAAASFLLFGSVATGGLLAVAATAVVGALITNVTPIGKLTDAAIEGANDLIDDTIPPVVTGAIAGGSPDVYVNGKNAPRAIHDDFPGDLVGCSRHSPPECVAEGSETVLINDWPAHRKSERSTCDAKTREGSPNVFYGGASVQMRTIDSEIPAWLQAFQYVGMAFALCRGRGWGQLFKKLTCLGTSFGLSMGADAMVSAAVGNPVHAPTGAKFLDGEDDQDFALAAVLPLIWQRHYNSRNLRSDTLFGQGWSTELELQLQLHPAGELTMAATLVDLQGLETPFEALAAAEKQTDPGAGWTLAHTADGRWVAQSHEGLYYDFGRPASLVEPGMLRLQSIQDGNGNFIALHHQPDPDSGAIRLVQILDSAKRLYDLHYDPQHRLRLAAISWEGASDAPVLARYRYDAHGRLIEVLDRMGQCTRTFIWHDSGPGKDLMASHRLPTGLQCTYAWQKLEGDAHPRVARHTSSAGDDWRFDYRLPDAAQAGWTQVTDARGYQQHWRWESESFNILEHVNAAGQCWRIHWNAQSLIACLTQPNGGQWRLDYDEQGRRIALHDPMGVVTTTDWDTRNNLPILETDAFGHTTTWRYDERDNLVSLTHPGGTQHYEVNAQGLITRLEDERGGISRWGYNGLGLLETHTDCSGRQTRFQYDKEGRLLKRTDADGQRTLFEHDVLHRLSQIILPDGAWQQWRYHPSGLLWRSIQNGPDGVPPPAGDANLAEGRALRITELNYTERGDLHVLRDAQGGTTRWHYDRAGDLVALEDAEGQHTRFIYNRAGVLLAQQGIDGIHTEYTLDELGRPAVVIQRGVNGDGQFEQENHTRLERDLLGRLVGKTTAETDTRYRYDALGRIVHIERHAHGGGGYEGASLLDEVQLSYSAAGDLIEETSTIHALLQPASGSAPTRRVSLAQARVRTLCHAHDALGNTIATTLPGGQSLNWLHYGSGHVHQINIDGRVITDIERDALHREVQRSQGGLQTRLTRDPMGRILRKTAQNPQRSVHVARFAGTVAQIGTGFTKHWDYDPAGQLRRRTDRVQGTQHYRYDALERLLGSYNSPPDHPQPEGKRIHASARQALDEAFAWDRASNALPLDVGAEPVAAAPRSLDVLSRHAGPGGSAGRVEHNRVLIWQDIRYHYDALGRVVRKISGKRQTLHLWWDSQNQLVQTATEHPHARGRLTLTRYHYDCLGRRIAVQTSQQDDSPVQTNGIARTQWFTWSGMRLLQQEWLDDEAAQMVRRAANTPGSALPSAINDIIPPDWDQADNLDELHRSVAPMPASWPPPGAETDRWQARHSQQARCHTFLYEEADSYAPLARIEHRLQDTVQARDIHYFHTDINGAPEELTDAQGQIVWQARYRSWGNTVMEEWWPEQTLPARENRPAEDQPHTFEQNLRYQGQYLDRQTGLHYNTFRYYDPDTGRFLCQDPIGLAGGLNLYIYAPNAFAWIDPWGLDELYALTAKKDGWYPVYEYGKKQSIGEVFLNKGDLWKIGESKNGSKRYTAKFLTSLNLKYETLFSGTSKETNRFFERMKIKGYLSWKGRLPPGNKCLH